MYEIFLAGRVDSLSGEEVPGKEEKSVRKE